MNLNLFGSRPRNDPGKIAAIKEWAAEVFRLLAEASVMVTAGNLTEAKEMLPKVEEAYRRCRAAYDMNSSKAKLG